MASKVTPSIPGAPSFLLAISYAARRVSILQTWTYSPQKRQDGSADVYSPPQVLQINGRLCHLVLAFPYVGDIANGRATSLRGHYSASSLSGRRRRARLLLRWPPSAAQTGRAVFPHPAFMNGLLRPEAKGSVRPARPA